jgi:hypothetical protein
MDGGVSVSHVHGDTLGTNGGAAVDLGTNGGVVDLGTDGGAAVEIRARTNGGASAYYVYGDGDASSICDLLMSHDTLAPFLALSSFLIEIETVSLNSLEPDVIWHHCLSEFSLPRGIPILDTVGLAPHSHTHTQPLTLTLKCPVHHSHSPSPAHTHTQSITLILGHSHL